MLLQITSVFLIVFSSVLCAPNIIQTLDLLMALLSESSDKESSTQNNDQIRTQPARKNNILKLGSRGTLDPIGGGHLLKVDDSYRSEENIWDSFDNFVNKLAILAVLYSNYSGNSQNTTQPEPIKRNKTEPDTRGTLDSLGGGNFVRLDDSYRSEESIWDSFENFINRLAILSMIYSKSYNSQNTTQPEPVKKDKTQPDTRGTLDPIGGGNLIRLVDSYRSRQFEQSTARQSMMRLAREDKSQKPAIVAGRVIDPYRSEQIFRSLDRAHFLDSLDNYQGGEVLRMLDAITGGDLLSSLDSSEATVFLNALRNTHTKHPKRMLDSMSGWSFGESKRNFDEIDNVGFTGFAKKNLMSSPRRGHYLALAKKNFDEIDRAGFETYNKRNFDEIDRTGFETFEKRDGKE